MISLPEKKFWQWALDYASMASRSKSSYLVHILQLPYKMKFLKSLRAGEEYFKDCLAVFNNSAHSVYALHV